MVNESSSKRITKGSLAKDRASGEKRSKLRNDSISQQTSSKKKRKADEVDFSISREEFETFKIFIPDDKGKFEHPKTANNQSLKEDQLIDLQQDDQQSQLERPGGRKKSPVNVDKESTGQAQRVLEWPHDPELEHPEGRNKSPINVDKDSTGQAHRVLEQPHDPELEHPEGRQKSSVNVDKESTGQAQCILEQSHDPETKYHECQLKLPAIVDKQSDEQGQCVPQQPNDPGDISTIAIREGSQNIVSPYMVSFGSDADSSSKQPTIFHQKHPFNPILENHDTSLYMEFLKWLRDGLLARHKNKKNNEDRYKTNKSALTVPFHFGVENISDKNWFYKLAHEGQPIDNSHIDVIMYYLRKKAKYSKSTAYSFSTADCNFSALIHNSCEVCADPDGGACNASFEQTITSYINGFRMYAAVPWYKVDNILIPVNVKDKFHWVLLVISFNDWSIMVYDSIRSTAHDAYIYNEVKKYAKLIPMYLAMSGFYKNKGLDLNVHLKYKLHSENDSFEIIHAKNIPQQHEESLDSGVYLAVCAEHLSDGTGIPNTPIDPELMHIRYAAQLWDYGMRKIKEDAVSDNEAPVKPIRTKMSGDIAKAIVI